MSDPTWVGVGIGDEVGTATIDTAGELTIVAHGLVDGQPVRLDTLTGGAAAAFDEDTTYYVVNRTDDTFDLVSIPGDTVITLGSSGGADVHTAVPHYSAPELRRADAVLLYGGTSDAFGARQGVRPGFVPVTVSGTTWTVEHLTAVVYPGLSSTDGPYRVQHESESGSLDPADGSNDRIDALDLQIQDDDEDASGFRRARVVYVVGTPAGSPSAPSVTANSLRLGTILVPSGGSPSPSVSTLAQWTVALGGVPPLRDDTERPSAGLYEGMLTYRQDTDEMEVWDGSAWAVLAGSEIAERGLIFAHLRQDSAQAIANTTPTALDWDNAIILRDGGWSASPNPSRFVPPRAGLWLFSATVAFDTDVGGSYREIRFRLNGANVQGSMGRALADTGAFAPQQPTATTPTIPIEVNGTSDFVEAFVQQNSGGSLNTFAGVARPSMIAQYAGPA